MSPRRAGSNELTREMIMDAARDLFVQKGYQHVSMRQIAKELNYSHGAIYYHFKNKAELFYALVEEHFDMLDKKLEQIIHLEMDNHSKLKEVFIGYIEFGLTHQSHYEIMFLIKDDEVINFMNQGPNISYEKFAQSVYMLTEKKVTLQEIWSIFISLHGFVTHYLQNVSTFEDVKDLAYAHADFLVKAIYN
ncbi:TetR family transcriptional regulator [Bacillus sp. 7586-K]|uniref:AcrR family transcriptional regulator n=2 Tax=Metabacillus niabensis TaxID=324854 RepID=A0ABT9YV89_9BACI|nr:TetR/AcrR family transcriptional regulator [Metabacillus niabensis]MDQ0223904.1 AcrR family transcriptional regulator [Metabacillus niabensis]PAD70277.1 TetR family transcriptional regulator [Bacillus sp. 7586-K]